MNKENLGPWWYTNSGVPEPSHCPVLPLKCSPASCTCFGGAAPFFPVRVHEAFFVQRAEQYSAQKAAEMPEQENDEDGSPAKPMDANYLKYIPMNEAMSYSCVRSISCACTEDPSTVPSSAQRQPRHCSMFRQMPVSRAPLNNSAALGGGGGKPPTHPPTLDPPLAP